MKSTLSTLVTQMLTEIVNTIPNNPSTDKWYKYARYHVKFTSKVDGRWKGYTACGKNVTFIEGQLSEI